MIGMINFARGNNILDLIFTNMADFYQSPVILAPISTSDHNVVLWKPKDYRYNTKGKVFKVKQRDMRWTNMNALESALAKFDWRLILCEGTIDQKVERFTKTLDSRVSSGKFNSKA